MKREPEHREQVGRVLTRRELLALLGTAAGAAVLAACAPGQTATAQATSAPAATAVPTEAVAASAEATTAGTLSTLPACIVRPELTEGPYFVDERLNRSDIRSDPADGAVKDGVPVQITFDVSQISGDGCAPLTGAAVDVWHCDALGVYSDTTDPGFNTVGQKWLRGYQVTDANGQATFTTIYPGWYQGRTVHIHFKIRTDLDSNQGQEFTSQFFFDDTLTDEVHALEPYAEKGVRTLRNAGDGIYQQSGGQLTLALLPAAEGYATSFDIGLQAA